MLIGEYIQKITDKNRVALPKKFRETIGSSVVISKGFEECLLVMSTAQWEEIVRKEISGSFISSVTRDISRYFLASSTQCDLDDQGRFVLPDFLKKYAKIRSNVAVLGLFNRIEVWDEKTWTSKKEKLGSNILKISKKLSNERKQTQY